MCSLQNKPILLYYWPTPNGMKISVMLEELGVPYDIHKINIGAGEQFSSEFLAVSPNNKIPAIVDPEGVDGVPISIFESGAILQYLGRKFKKFYPFEERAKVMVEQWLFWQIGGLGPIAGQNHHFSSSAPEKIPYAIQRYQAETNRLYGVLDKQLAGKEYIAGDISIADFSCIGWINAWETQGIHLDSYPNIKSWLHRLLARPGVSRGMAKK